VRYRFISIFLFFFGSKVLHNNQITSYLAYKLYIYIIIHFVAVCSFLYVQ